MDQPVLSHGPNRYMKLSLFITYQNRTGTFGKRGPWHLQDLTGNAGVSLALQTLIGWAEYWILSGFILRIWYIHTLLGT